MWDLDKFFFGFDDFILGSNHFLILPSCPKKYCSIQKKSKVAKNNHLAFSSSLSLNTHGSMANWQSKVIFFDKSLEKKYLQVSRKFFNGEKKNCKCKISFIHRPYADRESDGIRVCFFCIVWTTNEVATQRNKRERESKKYMKKGTFKRMIS